MMTIKKLSQDTIDKIAAGEVIESPRSVIKELVENSIDAGAKNISVEIKKGGKSYIRVTDDGFGIGSDDIELAFEKHATSKIKDFDDLYSLYTLGFRGEALASIASVSKLTAISKTADEDIGTKFIISGKDSKTTPVATNTGTSIVVKDLFYNIPARRKFLSSDITEANKINKLMYAYAIGYKGISFKYIRDDRLVFDSRSSSNLKFTISDLLDSTLEEELIEINGENQSYKLRAFISSPSYYRGNRSMQYIFVNDRLIESDDLTKIIEYEYRSYIPSGRFPAFFVFIYTDAKNIDVNIHPNKINVKFSYSDHLEDLLGQSIANKLEESKKLNKISKKEETDQSPLDFTDYQSILNKYSPVDSYSLVREEEESYESRDKDFFENEDINFEKILGQDEVNRTDLDKKVSEDNFKEEKISELSFIEEYQVTYKTSIFKRYSIFEKEDMLLILDHRRADEKIKASKFISDFKDKSIDQQDLLNPLIIKLSSQDIERFKNKKVLIDSLGIGADLISDKTIIIRSLPYIFEVPEDKQFFYDILDIDSENKEEFIYENLRKLIKSLSFRKGDKINKEEAESLYNSLMKEENPYKTYDGYPTIIELRSEDLERYFER